MTLSFVFLSPVGVRLLPANKVLPDNTEARRWLVLRLLFFALAFAPEPEPELSPRARFFVSLSVGRPR